jgi:GNAT superfamily N-acetyltransferase
MINSVGPRSYGQGLRSGPQWLKHPGGDHKVTSSQTTRFSIRPIAPADYAEWRPLWDGYNEFYGRVGSTALPEAITRKTWERFLNSSEPVYAVVAEDAGHVVGLAHYLFHRSTTRLHDVCYLQDLFTAESIRGKGAGRQLIESVYEAAKVAGCSRIYWQTQETNVAGRSLYDKVAKHHGFIVYAHDV